MTAEPAPLQAVTVLPPEKPQQNGVLRPVFQRYQPKPPPQFMQQWWDTKNAIAEIVARERAWVLAGKWIEDDEKLAMLTLLAVILGRSETGMLKAYREYWEVRKQLLLRVSTRKTCKEAGMEPPPSQRGLV